MLRLAVVALGLFAFTACSGQSGTEKDGGSEPCAHDPERFTEMAGAFAGDGLVVEVAFGALPPRCGPVPMTLGLVGSGERPNEQLEGTLVADGEDLPAFDDEIPASASGSTWTDPALDGAVEVVYRYRATYGSDGWTVQADWHGLADGAEVGGALGTWTVSAAR